MLVVALALAAPLAGAGPLPPFVPEVVAGHAISLLAVVETPTAITFGPGDADGPDLYATTWITGDVKRISLLWTPAGPVATGITTVVSDRNTALGVAFGPDGAMYVADSISAGTESGRTDGRVTRYDAGGSKVVVGGLPNGRHNTNNIDFGPDGRLYITNGNPNDNGVAGGPPDVFPYSGAILSVDAAEVTASPAILRWRDANGVRIPPSQIASHPVNADFASKVDVLAWGFRNVYDVAFDDAGVAWTSMNGADVPDSQDAVYRIAPGTFYGYPFCYNEGTPGGRDAVVVNNPLFPSYDCTGIAPAYALIGWHTCGTGLDHAPADGLFTPGVYVGECGPFQPDRVAHWSAKDPASATHNAGHKIVRVDAVGVHDFITGLAFPLDVRFGPDGAMYVADAGAIYRVVAVV